jgi:DNA-binding winged helix-turn-helix (wHTH) protein/ATP/maltotriose-dependent transcriptional regulator MalT
MTLSQPPSNPVHVRFDEFELDEANASLLRRGKPVAVAPTPFALLCALVRRPGTLFTKHALLDAVWGHQFVTDSVLKTAISKMRTALDDDPRQPRFIETVARRGYRFIAHPIAQAAAAPGPGAAHAAAPVRATDVAFIGRAEALARLDSLWKETLGGRRAIVWVAGEPGIGKTTLIERFSAGIGDAARARGHCVDLYGEGEPYLPVLEALAELCRDDAEVPALLRLVAPTWLLQLPWLTSVEEREALRRDLPGVGPERMLREMGQLLDRYTERRPLLLVTEDLHWSDRATIQLIDYLARRRGSARFMWLASFRLAEVVAHDHPLNPLRHELRLHGLCEEIVLDPFSEAEVAAYVAQRAPTMAGDEAFVRALHGRADGVPLFVASLITEALTRGAGQVTEAPRRPGGAALMAVPESLAALVDHYIAGLGDEQRTLLLAAATCGTEFRVSTVALVLGREIAWVDQVCAELARMQLWLKPAAAADDGGHSSYSFTHALFRQALYGRSAAAARTELHRKAGSALERERAAGLPVTASELAMHFDRGREPMSALRYYAEAASTALMRLSPAECMDLTQIGLDLLERAAASADRDALEIELASLRGLAAFHLLGVGGEAHDAFQRAYALLPAQSGHPQRALLLHNFGFVLLLRAEYEAALRVADTAHALAVSSKDPVLELAACAVRADVLLLQGRPRAASTLIERALPAIESIDAGPAHSFAQVTVLALLGLHLLHLGRIGDARQRLQQARARATQLGQPMGKMVAIWIEAMVEVRLGNVERVAALADELRALVEDHHLGHGRAAMRFFKGWADAHRGRPDEAFRLIREAFEDNVRMGMIAGGSEVLGFAVEALLLAGDYEEAQRQLEQALQIADTHGERVYLPQLLLFKASIARACGQASTALDLVHEAIAEARAQQAPWLELTALVELGEHGGASVKERRALAALVDALPEARDTALMARARVLSARGTRTPVG